MAINTMIPARFGAPAPDSRRAEWRRLGLFLAFGSAVFLLAVLGAAFVPFSWPDAIRRSAHPTIFVPLAVVLTVRMVRKDASEIAPTALFNPWPVGRTSVYWLLLGGALAGIVALTFVLGFGLRWTPNPQWSGASAAATPLIPTFPHTPTVPEYAAMLAIVGIVMVATEVGILKGRPIGLSSGAAG